MSDKITLKEVTNYLNEDEIDNNNSNMKADKKLNKLINPYIGVETISMKDFCQTVHFDENFITKLSINNSGEADLKWRSLDEYLQLKHFEYFNEYPERLQLENIDLKKFFCDIKTNLDSKYYLMNINVSTSEKSSVFGFITYIKSGIIISYDNDDIDIMYSRIIKESPDFKKVIGLFKGYLKSDSVSNKINIVYKSDYGFDKQSFDVKKINVNIEENYNDDFIEVKDKLIKELNKKDKSSLAILSGVTGSGKTTIIRYLTSRIKKNMIFVPPDMVDYITDPSFIPFLMNNNDSVLIIEDAEPALKKRNEGRRSSVSNILNLTDGLLSDCLNLSIICTFNTEQNELDEALMRKGRLTVNYRFQALSIEKSNALLKKLGHNYITDCPMTLAEIYNFNDKNNFSEKPKRTPIGFKS